MDLIDEILDNVNTIAVVGLSDNPARDSHGVSAYMQSQGYRIIPVNPALNGSKVLGEQSYADLASASAAAREQGVAIDLVDVFRRSEFAGSGVRRRGCDWGAVRVDAGRRGRWGGCGARQGGRPGRNHGRLHPEAAQAATRLAGPRAPMGKPRYLEGVAAALDDAIVSVAAATFDRVTHGLSDGEKAKRVLHALDSLHGSMRQLEMPEYAEELVALFYSAWYQPFQINSAYSLVYHAIEERQTRLTVKHRLDVVDFGSGAVAMELGLALAVLNAQGTRIEGSRNQRLSG